MSAVECLENETVARSAAQTAASRVNGAKSKGPVSEEGKAKSSRNGVRHGLCSGKVVFDDPEAEAEFEAMRAELEKAYIPTTEAERDCVRRMAAAKWRSDVCMAMEFALLQAIDRREACAMAGGDGLPSLNTLMRYRSRIDRDYASARAELEDLRRHRTAALQSGANSNLSERAFEPMDEVLAQLGTSEPEPSVDAPSFSAMNREERRRKQAIAHKAERNRR